MQARYCNTMKLNRLVVAAIGMVTAKTSFATQLESAFLCRRGAAKVLYRASEVLGKRFFVPARCCESGFDGDVLQKYVRRRRGVAKVG
jgi:hypothetical protein